MKTVLCIGELLIDFIGADTNKNISQQTSFIMKSGGAPANVACTIGALGGYCQFFGAIGADGFGDFLEKEIKKFNVQTLFLQKSELPTTIAFVSVDDLGERDFVFYRGADSDLVFGEKNIELIKKIEMIHFGGATGFLSGKLKKTYLGVLNTAYKNNIFISFDPNYRSAFWHNKKDEFIELIQPFLKKSDLIKLNKEEAFLITNIKDLSESIHFLKTKYKGTFVITLGGDGAFIFNNDWETHILAPKVDVVDTTGAGDSFVGSLLNDISRTADPKTIVKEIGEMLNFGKHANDIAASVCTCFGALTALEKIIGNCNHK